MKNTLLLTIMIALAFVACENTETATTPEATTETTETHVATGEIPSLEGEWTRSFQFGKGPDSAAHIFYRIGADSIQYEMQGMMPLQYTLQIDSFIAADNRWLCTRGDASYVVFIQPWSSDSINIFKKKVDNRAAGLEMSIPGAEAKSRFTSWNVFYRK